MELWRFVDAINQAGERPAAPADLQRFEETTGIFLPDDYCAFLMSCAGGRCVQKVSFDFPNGVWAGYVEDVGGLHKDPRYSLEQNRKSPPWPLHKDLVWIMNDHGGNPICLRFDGGNEGKLCLIDHELAPEDDDWTLEEASSRDWGYVLPLASSFTEFVRNLRRK
ncbi:SMI1/KNR4 family protein [Mesorhizobium sp. NPDC059025]|uniref:SMI1/KNR4 family protein n=1 Tax=unclassified Mesorhizobium TaxID=325217 RepID=UPI0036A708CC